jgi:hypothetical protein
LLIYPTGSPQTVHLSLHMAPVWSHHTALLVVLKRRLARGHAMA